jgi:hypothetical protein
VDVAFLAARLVAAGHTPAEADVWAENIPTWRSTPIDVRAALAVQVWGLWEHTGRKQPRPLWAKITPAARAMARHRLGFVVAAAPPAHASMVPHTPDNQH